MNGKKARTARTALRQRNEQLLATIRAARPVRVSTDGERETWQRGPLTLTAPVVPHDYPTELRDALTSYRAALLHGECPRCTIEQKVTEAGTLFTRHTVDCHADPDRLVALAAEHGITFERGI
ncbi:hypothetical protein ACIRJL_17180 [Streptomyces sp. NPDC102383]|uniref:hypothetical protein n=1 Tax=Streptomyces sp. NPDC102383 TaxID=3366165 RepID=UPI00382419A0